MLGPSIKAWEISTKSKLSLGRIDAYPVVVDDLGNDGELSG